MNLIEFGYQTLLVIYFINYKNELILKNLQGFYLGYLILQWIKLRPHSLLSFSYSGLLLKNTSAVLNLKGENELHYVVFGP